MFEEGSDLAALVSFKCGTEQGRIGVGGRIEPPVQRAALIVVTVSALPQLACLTDLESRAQHGREGVMAGAHALCTAAARGLWDESRVPFLLVIVTLGHVTVIVVLVVRQESRAQKSGVGDAVDVLGGGGGGGGGGTGGRKSGFVAEAVEIVVGSVLVVPDVATISDSCVLRANGQRRDSGRYSANVVAEYIVVIINV